MNDMQSHRARVLRLLRECGAAGMSAAEMDDKHGVYRAAARVRELRESGYPIQTLKRPGHTAVYVLVPPSIDPLWTEAELREAYGK